MIDYLAAVSQATVRRFDALNASGTRFRGFPVCCNNDMRARAWFPEIDLAHFFRYDVTHAARAFGFSVFFSFFFPIEIDKINHHFAVQFRSVGESGSTAFLQS